MKGLYPVAPLNNVLYSHGLPKNQFELTLPRRKSSVEAERLLPKSSFDFNPNYPSGINSRVSVKNPSLYLYGIGERLSRKGAIHGKGKTNNRLLPGSSIGFGPNTPVKRRSSGYYGFEQTNYTPVKKVSNYGFGNTLDRNLGDGYIKVDDNEEYGFSNGGYRKNNKQNTKKKKNRTKTKNKTKQNKLTQIKT